MAFIIKTRNQRRQQKEMAMAIRKRGSKKQYRRRGPRKTDLIMQARPGLGSGMLTTRLTKVFIVDLVALETSPCPAYNPWHIFATSPGFDEYKKLYSYVNIYKIKIQYLAGSTNAQALERQSWFALSYDPKGTSTNPVPTAAGLAGAVSYDNYTLLPGRPVETGDKQLFKVIPKCAKAPPLSVTEDSQNILYGAVKTCFPWQVFPNKSAGILIWSTYCRFSIGV